VLPQIPLGLILGFLLLEVVLRLNTSFLLKGIAPPAAMDAAVLTLDYDVRYSDGDAFCLDKIADPAYRAGWRCG